MPKSQIMQGGAEAGMGAWGVSEGREKQQGRISALYLRGSGPCPGGDKISLSVPSAVRITTRHEILLIAKVTQYLVT